MQFIGLLEKLRYITGSTNQNEKGWKGYTLTLTFQIMTLISN